MALTLSQAGTANSTTSNASFSVTLTQSVAAGDMLIVCIAADNAGGGGASSVSSVTDSKSHTYTQRAITTQDPGAANAGATSAIYTAFVTTAMTTSDTVTINFSPNTQYKAAVVWEAAVASTEFPKYLSNGSTTGNTANPQLASSSVTSGDGIIYALAVESNATLTGDSDTSNGTWSTLYTDIGSGGTAATSMRIGSQYKVVTGTATQTFNATITAADWALTYIIIDPAAKIGRTGTQSGTGGSSASRLVKRLRTATAAGTGSSSATGVKAKSRTASATGTGSSSATGIYKRVRTATGTGTGGSTSDGQALHQRTATGSGTGSQTAVRLIIRFRTATGTGVGGGVADKDLLHIRTASASGAGSSSATGVRIPGGGAQTFSRTATGTGIGGGSGDVDLVHLRTATGTGAGTSTVVSRFFTPRTATGSGLGSSTVVGVRVKVRTATASGTGGSSVTFVHIRRRTATAAGTGGSSVTELLIAKRTATAAGAGSSSIVEILIALRTATATGAGTSTSTGCKVFRKTATGSGSSTELSVWVKSLIFYPPSSSVALAEFDGEGISNRLFSYAAPFPRGNNIFKLNDNTYTDIDPRDPSLYKKVYFGGHQNFLTPEEKADLVAAGYGGYIT